MPATWVVHLSPMDAVCHIAVAQPPDVFVPVPAVFAQGEEGGHEGVPPLGWMDLLTVRVAYMSVALQPILQKLVYKAVVDHEHGVVGCSGEVRHCAVQVVVDQVVHGRLQPSGILRNFKTF